MAVLTDGAEDLRAILSSQASVHAKDGTMRAGSIAKASSACWLASGHTEQGRRYLGPRSTVQQPASVTAGAPTGGRPSRTSFGAPTPAQVVSHSCSTTPNGPVLMVTELEVLSIPGTQDVDMQAAPTPGAADACAAISLAGVAAAGARKAEISTPGAAVVAAGGTPGPAPRGGGAVVAVKVEPSPSNLRTPGST